MPIDYKKYPKNWKTEIRPRILKRADNKCEWCNVENYSLVKRFNPDRLIKIVLTIAHLDHDINNNSDENLRALCQKCHLNYNQEHHLKNRRKK